MKGQVTLETEKQKRGNTSTYPCIREKNDAFFQYFKESSEKIGKPTTQLAFEFEKFLSQRSAKLEAKYPYEKDIQGYSWQNYLWKLKNSQLKSIDYATACLLIEFFEKKYGLFF